MAGTGNDGNDDEITPILDTDAEIDEAGTLEGSDDKVMQALKKELLREPRKDEN